MSRLGELLVGAGVLSQAAVNRALEFQRLGGDRVRLGSILVNWDLLDEEPLLRALARLHRCSAVGWETLALAKPEAIALLPAAHAIRLGVIPYAAEKGIVRAAFVNPSDLSVLDQMTVITGRRVIPTVTTEARLMQAHHRFYGRHVPQEFRSVLQKLQRRMPREKGRDGPAAAPIHSPASPEAAQTTPNLSAMASGAPRPTTLGAGAGPSTGPRIAPIQIPEFPLLGISELAGQVVAASVSPVVSAVILDPDQPPWPDLNPAPTKLRDYTTADLQELAAAGPSTTQPGGATPFSRGESAAELRDYKTADLREETSTGGAKSLRARAGDNRPTSASEKSRGPDEIGDAVLHRFLTDIPRVLLLAVGGNAITGWRGRGPGLSPERIASLVIPTDERSILADLQRSGLSHFGPLEADRWPRAFLELLGLPPPDCSIFPIWILDGVAAFLYADRLGMPMRYEDFGLMARAAASTANVLSRFWPRPHPRASAG